MARRPSLESRLKAVRAETDPLLLEAALSDEAPAIAEAAAKRITLPRSAPALAAAYHRLHAAAPEGGDPGCWARMAVLEALGRLEAPEGEAAAFLGVRTVQVEPVAGGMADTATGLRVAASAVLANLRPPGALLDLAWLLYDFEPNAGCSRAERPFAKLATRVAGARAIGALGDPSGAAVLALKLAFPGEELPEVLAECMDGLVALEEPRTVELLSPFLGHANAYLVAAAGTALAAAGGRRVIGLLLSAMEAAPPDAREALVYALGSIRADEAREALRSLTKHTDPRISRAAKELVL